MGKSRARSSKTQKKVTFFLDECLPWRIAEALKTFGYPIISWYEEFQGQQGLKEPYLIPYLGAKEYTWITKDDEAKREHENEIRTAGISVIWVRGLEREKGKPKKNDISIRDVHRMLTDKLDIAESEIGNSNRSLYYMLWMDSAGKPVLRRITLEDRFKKLPKHDIQEISSI